MIFKKLNMEYAAFDLDNITDLRQMLIDNCKQIRDAGPMSDVLPVSSSLNPSDSLSSMFDSGG